MFSGYFQGVSGSFGVFSGCFEGVFPYALSGYALWALSNVLCMSFLFGTSQLVPRTNPKHLLGNY